MWDQYRPILSIEMAQRQHQSTARSKSFQFALEEPDAIRGKGHFPSDERGTIPRVLYGLHLDAQKRGENLEFLMTT